MFCFIYLDKLKVKTKFLTNSLPSVCRRTGDLGEPDQRQRAGASRGPSVPSSEGWRAIADGSGLALHRRRHRLQARGHPVHSSGDL